MAPLTRCRASAGRVPNALMRDYYVQRASAGLILSEATAVDPSGVGYPDTPGIWSPEQVQGWKVITDAVHAAGGKMLTKALILPLFLAVPAVVDAVLDPLDVSAAHAFDLTP